MKRTIKGLLNKGNVSYHLKPDERTIGIDPISWMEDARASIESSEFEFGWKVSSTEVGLDTLDFKVSSATYPPTITDRLLGPVIGDTFQTMKEFIDLLYSKYRDKEIWISLEVEIPDLPLEEYELFPSSNLRLPSFSTMNSSIFKGM